MIEEEILMMKAGQELDMRVAEDVMGYTVVVDDIFGGMQIDGEQAWLPLRCYSGDESTIPGILGRLRQAYGVSIDPCCFQGAWQADMTTDGEGVKYYYPEFNAFSLPEAICKAALLLAHANGCPDGTPV